MRQSRSSPLALAAVLAALTAPRLLAQPPPADLIQAINSLDEARAAILLKQGADPNARDSLTQPAIVAASYFGLEKTVRALLSHNADFRALDNDGIGALHASALAGHASIVALLIDRGLGVNDRARTDGMTPLAYAAVRGHMAVVRTLLARHADVNLADAGSNSPLLHASMRGRADTVRVLVERGANVDAASRHGWTPLMAAAWEGHASVVKILLKGGANPKLVNRQGQSAAMLAKSEGHGDVVKMLAETGSGAPGR